jgi:phytoene synthase
VTAAEAYRRCTELTRASSTSFYQGMRLLPRERREALFAVYAFARRIDDAADDDGAGDVRRQRLADARDALHVPADHPEDPVLVALADACARFPIPLDAFEDMLAGAEADVAGAAYPSFDELVVYCRQVGGSVGRLCVGVFETRDRPAASALADDLGVALQLTNILRDLAEDRERGRVYLPQEDLRRFGCRVDAEGFHGPFAELVRFEAERAEGWYERGLGVLPLLDRRSAASVAAMAGAYRRLLRRIARDPGAAIQGRVSLPGWEKGLVAARSLVGAGA